MLDLSNPIAWALSVLTVALAGGIVYLTGSTGAWLEKHAKFLDAQQKATILATENEVLHTVAATIEDIAIKESKKIHLSVANPLVRWAAQQALNHAGGLLSENGWSEEETAAKILAILPPAITTVDTTGAIITLPPSVTVKPLPPIGDH